MREKIGVLYVFYGASQVARNLQAKNLPASAEDVGSIPELERSPGE